MSHLSSIVLFKMAFFSLTKHLIRTGLTLLGMMIGIAALMTTLALGKGADQEMQKKIQSMGQNWVSIYSATAFNQDRIEVGRFKEKPLTYGDFKAIRQLVPNIYACSPYSCEKSLIKYQGTQIATQLIGVNDEFFKLEQRKLSKGMAFTPYHLKTGTKVAILGQELATKLFGTKNPITEIIHVENAPFRVIGVLNNAIQQSHFQFNPDLELYIPITALSRKKIKPQEQSIIENIILKPLDLHKTSYLIFDLKRLLRFLHHLESKPDDFTVLDHQALFKAMRKTSETFNLFLLIASVISLLIGSIGVMNMMLVSVIERKKEIGLKMAIGATPNQILIQFLVESTIVCLIGGILGIGLGSFTSIIVGYFSGLPWKIDWEPIGIALMTTSLVGILSGYYPAYKASRLDPIQALHSQ